MANNLEYEKAEIKRLCREELERLVRQREGTNDSGLIRKINARIAVLKRKLTA